MDDTTVFLSEMMVFFADDIVNDPDLVMEAWTRHFENLATPQNHPEHDDSHNDFIEEDLLVMEWICEQSSIGHEHPISPGEVTCALKILTSESIADDLLDFIVDTN